MFLKVTETKAVSLAKLQDLMGLMLAPNVTEVSLGQSLKISVYIYLTSYIVLSTTISSGISISPEYFEPSDFEIIVAVPLLYYR